MRRNYVTLKFAASTKEWMVTPLAKLLLLWWCWASAQLRTCSVCSLVTIITFPFIFAEYRFRWKTSSHTAFSKNVCSKGFQTCTREQDTVVLLFRKVGYLVLCTDVANTVHVTWTCTYVWHAIPFERQWLFTFNYMYLVCLGCITHRG